MVNMIHHLLQSPCCMTNQKWLFWKDPVYLLILSGCQSVMNAVYLTVLIKAAQLYFSVYRPKTQLYFRIGNALPPRVLAISPILYLREGVLNLISARSAFSPVIKRESLLWTCQCFGQK